MKVASASSYHTLSGEKVQVTEHFNTRQCCIFRQKDVRVTKCSPNTNWNIPGPWFGNQLAKSYRYLSETSARLSALKQEHSVIEKQERLVTGMFNTQCSSVFVRHSMDFIGKIFS